MPLPQQTMAPMETFIAAPLEALFRAQTMASHTTAKYIQEMGFVPDANGGNQARMAQFEYVHPMADPKNPGVKRDTPVHVRVPLLSLLPIPVMEIAEASFDLQLRVVVAEEMGQSYPGNTGLTGPDSRLQFTCSLTNPKTAEQTPTLSMNIKVKQASTPEGLAHLLNLMGETTTARPKEG